MAQDYAKVLQALDTSFEVIGRGEASAITFDQATGITPRTGGVGVALQQASAPETAIVAVGVRQLAKTATALIEAGTRHILLEKPGGVNIEEIRQLHEVATRNDVDVWLAYNRRFYASTLKAEELIADDGGVTSVQFEFTEWSHKIRDLPKAPSVKERWFLGNSTHVVDLVFYLCGVPADWKYWHAGSLNWHPAAARFCGAGVTDRGVMFSYLADWESPGRWGIEILTRKRRLIFRPMEQLQVMHLGSVQIEPMEIESTLDKGFKPGLYRQTRAFLTEEASRFCFLPQQVRYAELYSQMGGY